MVKTKKAAALLSVVSNTLLVLLKIVVGVAIGSVSIISEAIHSAIDLVASLIALFAVKTADKPADEDHPFGHHKIENISGSIEALLIFFAAGWIIFEAIGKLLHPTVINRFGWGLVVMATSAFANFLVSNFIMKTGKETDSVALQADAWHLRTDVYTSIGVLTALVVMVLFKYFAPDVNVSWIDPVAAILVALLIVRAAWNLTAQSGRDLLDASLPENEIGWIKDYLREFRPRIFGFHHIRTRKSGSKRFVEFHMLVDPELTVRESHSMSDIVIKAINNRYANSQVTIHIEPCDGKCLKHCLNGCFLTTDERVLIHNSRD
ncbi:MAG: hypothetical protein A3K03_03585 [Bdellovibrionales bacterium RIFOXYD1_FULL_44_7]|nr:MAG: hypothetical protein A3K03_03585 [Bdellovibrionales bacterium RIFOXYD1_FULL_44_7]